MEPPNKSIFQRDNRNCDKNWTSKWWMRRWWGLRSLPKEKEEETCELPALLLLHRLLQHLQLVEETLTGRSWSDDPFPAVSQCLFFHQSLPGNAGVPGRARSERLCKHNKSRKLTTNPSRGILYHTTMWEFHAVHQQHWDCSEDIRRPSPYLPLNEWRASAM